VMLLAAFGAGVFGAAIGGLSAFVFTGFMVLVGVAAALGGSDFDFLGNVAFGPVFGPHVAFAGGVAAAAFAARRGDLESGKDIVTPLAGVGDPLVLLVGGLFGAGGYVVNQALAALLVVNGNVSLTDTVALTVGISAVAVRLVFGKSGLFGDLDEEAERRGRFKPGGQRVWLAYQEGFLQAALIGAAGGLFSAWLVVAITGANPDYATAAGALAFGISAASLILLQTGFTPPVTHHMTLPAAVAAAAVVAAAGPGLLAVLLGAAAGVLGALFGELYSRLFLIHGDTHVDPPAFAIFTMATVVVLFRLLFGGV